MIAEQIELKRRELTSVVAREHKSALGQFLTPYPIARFMASLFSLKKKDRITILDPGAGIGTLSASLLDRLSDTDVCQVRVIAFEMDDTILAHLHKTYKEITREYKAGSKKLEAIVIPEDYIECSHPPLMLSSWHEPVDYAILNPPYGKINTDSRYRMILRESGIETVNLYSGFVALALKQLRTGGQLVAIIPRSFCNGPYYKPFRAQILSEASLEYIHLFDSRRTAFVEDGVLQENIIIHLIKGKKQTESVTVSTSHGIDFSSINKREVPFEAIVSPQDHDCFIHIPENGAVLFANNKVACSIDELKINVSTGPVVDFRMKDHLRKNPVKGTVPLLYSSHFDGWKIKHPNLEFKKNNAIALNDQTRKWLYPNGFYTVVRRFSSKEEKRRVVACVVRADEISTDFIGIENHLNVFHMNRQGLPEDIAYGLAAFLNSGYVDTVFRTFSGHTQVNVTDLKKIKYPNLRTLSLLGKWARSQKDFDYHLIDKKVEGIL